MSFLQSSITRAGAIFGGLLFLKLISNTFCLYFGRKEPLLTVKGYLEIVAGSFMVLGVLSHFLYVEEGKQKII